MEIVFRCDSCGKKLVAEEPRSGMLADCPACGKMVVVPVTTAKPPSVKQVLRVHRETSPDTKTDEAKPPAENPPATETAPAPPTLVPERPHNLEIVVGWICVVVGTILALLLPKAVLVYLTFFIGAFLMSCVLFVRRKFLHFIVLLLCTLVTPPVLMRQDIWKNVAPPPSPAVAAPVRESPSPTRTQKVVIDAQGEIKVVPVAVPEPSARVPARQSASSSPATAKQSAPADPFSETVELAQKSNRPHEPKTRSAEDQYEALLKNQNDVPPLVPEDVLASTPMSRGPDFVWQQSSSVTLSPDDPAPVADIPFVIYSESGNEQPYVPSGKMGNQGAMQVDMSWDVDPHSGKTCIRVSYTMPFDWTTYAWQNPPNNWGDMPGGYDFSKAKKLTFWAKGEKGGERAEFKVGMEQSQNAVARDSFQASTGVIRLPVQWKKFSIPIEKYDRSRLITAFLVGVSAEDEPIAFYLDDVQFE